MKKINLLFIFILILTVLISCGDDNPAGGNQTTLLPMKSGTYWIYMNYMLDSNNNRTQENPTIDSTIVDGNITIHDTTGSIFVTYSKDNTGMSSGDSVYYHTDKMKVFVYSSYFKNLLGNSPYPLEIPIYEQWVKLVDSDDEDWKVYEGPFPETNVIIGTISGTITILGANSGNESITLESTTYNARKFTIRFLFTGNFKYGNFPAIPVNFERKTYLYFADNIGLIKSYTQSMKIEISPFPGIPITGQEQILIRHHIAN